MKKIVDFGSLKEFYYRNRVVIWYSFIIAIICYGYELFNFTLSIDEELQSFSSAVDLKKLIRDGRWGSYFINILISPHSLMPYLPTLIAVLSLAFFSILFVTSEKNDLKSQIIFSTIFISYPLHSYYMEFNILGAPVGIGLVLSIISYLIIKKSIEDKVKKIKLLCCSVIALTFSFSIYQGLLTIYILLVLMHLFNQLLNDKEFSISDLIKQGMFFLIIYLSAFIIYKTIDFGLTHFYIPELRTLPVYTEHYLGWGKISVRNTISTLLNTTLGYLMGRKFYGSGTMISILIIFPVLLYITFTKMKGKVNKSMAILILFISLISPFFVMYFVGSKLPPRSLVALPLMLAYFWWITSQHVSYSLRSVMTVIAFVLFFNNTYHTTRLFYSSYVSWQADRDMANRIIERIYKLDLPDEDQIKISFIGKYKHPENELFLKTNDAFGASFFCWGRGEFSRINSLFKTKGINNFKIITSVQQEEISENLDSVPCWPRKGSVTLKEGIVVVKLSDQSKLKKKKYNE